MRLYVLGEFVMLTAIEESMLMGNRHSPIKQHDIRRPNATQDGTKI